LIWSYWENFSSHCNSDDYMVLSITPKLWCHRESEWWTKNKGNICWNQFSAEEYLSGNQQIRNLFCTEVSLDAKKFANRHYMINRH